MRKYPCTKCASEIQDDVTVNDYSRSPVPAFNEDNTDIPNLCVKCNQKAKEKVPA